MRAPFAASQRSDYACDPQLSTFQADMLLAMLVAEFEGQADELAQCGAALVANSPEDTTGLGRALSALHLYGARLAIEEIEGALARMEAGRYGTCVACDRPIPFEHLEAIPQARLCAACPASAIPAADRSAEPRLGSGRGEHTGMPPPVRSPQHLLGSPRNRRGHVPVESLGEIPDGDADRLEHDRERTSLALFERHTRHPSSARYEGSSDELSCPACGWTSTTAAGAPAAVRQVLALATRLLGPSEAERRHVLDRPTTLPASVLPRVAQLRDELHVTANRVERFDVDDFPILDPVRIAAPTAASAVLAPEHLLYQLDLTASRLAALLGSLSEDDWRRNGRVGDRLVTLGELVADVLHSAVHDLLDLLHTPDLAPDRVAVLADTRTRRERKDPPRPTRSPINHEVRDVAAS